MTTIGVSAQFGGPDAAEAVLPHFRALKSAAKGVAFDGFPFPKLAFILRVDGEVTAYGQSGAGMVEFEKNGEYVSVDIGIPRDVVSAAGATVVSDFVARSIVSTVDLLKALGDTRLKGVDWGGLETVLKAFAASYKGLVG